MHMLFSRKNSWSSVRSAKCINKLEKDREMSGCNFMGLTGKIDKLLKMNAKKLFFLLNTTIKILYFIFEERGNDVDTYV